MNERALLKTDVADVLPSCTHSLGIVRMLTAYFDDSGTHADSRVAVIGGWCGTEAQWSAFDAEWTAKLQEPLPGKPPIRQFHLSHCAAGEGEFAKYAPAERDAVRFDFREIILKHKLTGIAAMISRFDWDDLVTGKVREVMGTAEEACALRCADRAVEWARQRYPEDPYLIIVFDKGRESQSMRKLAQGIANAHRYNPHVGVAFLPVEKYTPLQAADIIATESYWRTLLGLDAESGVLASAHFRHFLATMEAEGVVADREVIEQTVRIRRAELGDGS